ncbi:dipeptidase [Fibrobacterales bacterium]|nr:dipeptidase [Fibrobacterales bacterium]
MSSSIYSQVNDLVERDFSFYLEELKKLVKIPSISFNGFDKKHIADCANAVAELFKKTDFQSVKLLDTGTDSPAVFAEMKGFGTAPVILLYAHYDVQPQMQEDRWHSPPFEPQIRNERLYGRGAADDKAGIIANLAAALTARKLKEGKNFPTLKFLIEGEEEAGSPNLEKLLSKYKDELKCDAAIICDVANFSEKIPAVVASLRGMLAVEIEVRSMNAPLHSGMWSGAIPDAVQGLCKMLSSLTDENGKIAIKGMPTEPALENSVAESYEKISEQYGEEELRKESELFPKTQLLTSEIIKSMWRDQTLTITTIQAGDRKNAGNVLQNSAWARISLRLTPGTDLEIAKFALLEHLKAVVPWGLELSIKVEGGSAPAWETKTEHRFFQKMLSALETGYGEKPLITGCGASIPLVPALEKAFAIPLLLIGIEDPLTNAHGENESVSLDSLKKTIVSETVFFLECGNP